MQLNIDMSQDSHQQSYLYLQLLRWLEQPKRKACSDMYC